MCPLFVVKDQIGFEMTGDLSAIPSLNIKTLLDKARKCPEQTSIQLQENLENAGLVDKLKGEK